SGVPTTLNTAVSGTSALLNFTNGGIYDATSKNDLETVGNAQISTTISAKWGSGSIYLDGTNSRFNFSPANLFILGTAAFTFETWFYPVAAGGSGTIFTCKLSGGRGFYLVWSTGSVLRLLVNAGTNWNVDISSSALTLNTWHHIAVTRSGSTFYLLADGSLANSQGGVSGEICSTVPIVKIGSDDANGSLMTQSYLQDTRFTNGIARYTGAYTVPTAAFPTL
ncbi:LamG domain-containing protein, partial [bacterium]|nr:LamG domain-containing protein [bacterium]